MNKKMRISAFIIVLAIAAIISAGAGYYMGINKNSRDLPYSFYAEITEIDGSDFQVKGLAVNQINYRGDYIFRVDEKTLLIWRGTEMDSGEFRPGQRIAVTFAGVVFESYPQWITEIVKVELLDDEK